MKTKKKNKMCESVEEFLSRGGQVEYCEFADERMMKISELENAPAKMLQTDYYQWLHSVPRKTIGYHCYERSPMPRMP